MVYQKVMSILWENLIKMSLCPIFILLYGFGIHAQNEGSNKQFDIYETSIAEFHNALINKETTIKKVIEQYFKRIETYDNDNTKTTLNSYIIINKNALAEAEEKDRNFSIKKLAEKPLYGVPILIKDNINTKNLPTSGGAVAFKENQPSEDAFIIKKIKEAGAIIIGKANLSEFAFDYKGSSSLGGIVKNSYDLTKGPGGSSSGTASGVTSNLAMAGIGTDTGGSIRVPSSLAGLIGIRPSMNLISQNGVMPLSPWQDTVGPICRSVEDCAIILGVIVGYDSTQLGNQRIKYNIYSRHFNNFKEYQKATNTSTNYSKLINKNKLENVRIGVVRELFKHDSIATNIVNPAINIAIERMKKAGAIVKDVKIKDLDSILKNYISMSNFEFKNSLESYLNSWSTLADNHILDYKDLIQSEGYLDESKKGLLKRDSINFNSLTEEQLKIYKKNTEERPVYSRARIVEALESEEFDVLLYPTIVGVASPLGENTNSGLNNRLSAFSGLPSITFPAGMASNDGLLIPIGIELLGREFDELTLLNIAYSYEQLFNPRIPPETTPRIKSK